MKLTAKTRSAVAAMADLALMGRAEPVALADIAERQSLSLSFLEQIFARLRRAGLVESQRGARGGYLLARAPDEISVRQVVMAVDEDIRFRGCRPGSAVGCKGASARCLTHDLWRELDDRIEDYLGAVSLADLAASASQTTQKDEAIRA